MSPGEVRMSRSSRFGDDSRPSGDDARTSDRVSRRTTPERARTTPVAGLVAAFAVFAGLSAYAVVFDGVDDAAPDRRADGVAATTLARAHEAVTSGGVADPARLADAVDAGPDGYHLRVTLSASGRTWRAGPTPPDATDPARASRRVGVAVGPGRVRPGELAVEVWR
jgi:hypothetical protein